MNEALKNYEPCFDAIKHADEIENELREYIDRKNALISITEEKAKKETDRTPKDEDRVVDVQPTKDHMKKEKSHEELRIQRVILLSECEEYERKIRKKKDEYERLVKNIGLLKREMEKLRSSGVKHTEEPSFKEIKPENIELISPRRANLGEEKLNKAIESLKAERIQLREKVEGLMRKSDYLDKEVKSLEDKKEKLKIELRKLEEEFEYKLNKLKDNERQLKEHIRKLNNQKKLIKESLIPLYEIQNNWDLLKSFIPFDFKPNNKVYDKKIAVSKKHGTIWGHQVKSLEDIKNKEDREFFKILLSKPYVKSIGIGEIKNYKKVVSKPLFKILPSQDKLDNNIVRIRFRTLNRSKGNSHIINVGVKSNDPCMIFTFFVLITLLSIDPNILMKS